MPHTRHPAAGAVAAAQAAFAMLERRVPGSRWDLIHWSAPARPRFLLGRLSAPHPGLARLEEERRRPPLLLERPDRQLSLGFPGAPDAAAVDWLWPLGPRGRLPWVCGRLGPGGAETLAGGRRWLAPLLAELGEAWPAAAPAAADGVREFEGILYHESSPLADVVEQIGRAARGDTPVFLQGESGVGKELFARALHRLSPRADGAFVAQNGGALPDTLIESELFGHSRGSFTGAREERVGLFELANGGTFFLDEVGDLSGMLQVRLLRVLQDRLVRRIGENRLRPVDFRLVTATHRDLEAAVREGRFRLDLWFRIQGLSLRIPPLRERPQDVPVLARAFLSDGAERHGLALRELGEDAVDALSRYHWPGNVRELQNEIARAQALHGEAGRLQRWMLSDALFDRRGPELPAALAGLTLQEAQEDLERRMLRQTLDRFGGNRSRSARALGLSRQGLLKKLKRLGLERVALGGPADEGGKRDGGG